MSIKVMVKVWESDLPSSEKFVLLALADHARDDGSRVYPSIATVARKTGFSERTVQRCMRTLQAMGILTIVKKSVRYGTTEYLIRGDNLSPLQSSRGDKHDIQGCQAVTPGVTNTTFRGDTVSPKPLENRQLNLKREPAKDLRSESLFKKFIKKAEPILKLYSMQDDLQESFVKVREDDQRFIVDWLNGVEELPYLNQLKRLSTACSFVFEHSVPGGDYFRKQLRETGTLPIEDSRIGA